MRDGGNWTMSLGSWGGLRLRLHMFFLLFAACTLYLSWREQQTADGDFIHVAALSVGLLLVSVLIHGIAHAAAAIRLGAATDQLILGPLGEISPVKTPADPQAEFFVHLAGPAANLVVCVVCLPVLLMQTDLDVLGLLHPLRPVDLVEGSTWLVGLKLAFWINWLLLLVNLIPAFPFDGGRALRAWLAQLWVHGGRQRAAVLVGTVAKFAAVGLLVLAWFMRDGGAGTVAPAWFALVLLAIFLFFSAKQESEPIEEEPPEEDDLFGYDFSQGYTSLERKQEPAAQQPGLIGQWLEQRRREREERRIAMEREEELRVDEILARLHQSGMDSLSSEDRALLERVSARLRNRPGKQA